MSPKLLGLVLLSFLSLPSWAQVGGKGSYRFLNLVTSARNAALGGKAIAVSDADNNLVYWNPALLNTEMAGRVALNYVNYIADVNMGSAVYSHNFHKAGMINMGMKYIDYGSFTYSDNGLANGTFGASEMVFYGSYAYEIIDSTLTVGANLKLISSQLEQYHSFGMVADLAANYRFKSGVTASLVLKNAGAQITQYEDTYESPPFEMQLGISGILAHLPLRWLLIYDQLQRWDVSFSNPSFGQRSPDGSFVDEQVSAVNNFLRHMIVGVELLPGRNFNLRASYNFRRGNEMKMVNGSSGAGFAAGFGFKAFGFVFDYGYAAYHAAGSSHLFSMSFDMGDMVGRKVN